MMKTNVQTFATMERDTERERVMERERERETESASRGHAAAEAGGGSRLHCPGRFLAEALKRPRKPGRKATGRRGKQG